MIYINTIDLFFRNQYRLYNSKTYQKDNSSQNSPLMTKKIDNIDKTINTKQKR